MINFPFQVWLRHIDRKTLRFFDFVNFCKGSLGGSYTPHPNLPPFEQVNDSYIPILFEASAKKVGVVPDITTFHAGAETHIYANQTNSKGEKFIPYLVGLATVCNMHSKNEYLEYKSILKGHEVLTEFFKAYNS